ncbi:MAG: serine hydrolase [Anaerolineaceae bacterium]|nr:serine hydrolase [Anaerolineaceae bacterium]
MNKVNGKLITRVVGIGLILLSLILMVVNFQKSKQQHCLFPPGSTIATVDVGGLDREQSIIKLKSIFEKPIQIQVGNLAFDLTNEQVGLEIQYEEMVSVLNCEIEDPFSTFWSYIWHQTKNDPINIKIIYDLNEGTLVSTIGELISPAILVEPKPYEPISGTTRFEPGKPGVTFNQDELVQRIKDEGLRTNKNVIQIPITQAPPLAPTIEQIATQVRSIITDADFSGVVEIYAERMSDHHKIQILNWYGEEREPGVAFTAASTMKIPIMLSTYWRQDIPLSEIMQDWIEYMVIYSENDPADRLMEQIDPVRGPLLVTNDIQSLGLENSFIAGYFYLGAPLLNFYETPANQRSDAFIDPDVYNQTTPEDIGKLLSLIYECSQGSSAQLIEKSQEKITQEECQLIIDTLAANKMGALMEAGLPEGLKIAHKHGWSQEKDGLVHSFSDAGIVFGPEEDFVLAIFTYSPNQLLFDIANPFLARISQTIYNGFNPQHQIAWPFTE